jgi:hypothetical protein
VGSELTVTGVPGMSGNRMGVDRDRDGFLDRDELDNGSDPGDPASTPNLAAIDDAASGRASFSIGPNPFRESTEIRFALSQKGEVDATVYDIMGREVSRLANGRLLDAGAWTLRWDGRWSNGRAAGPGVYFVRVKTPQQTWNRTVVRLR